MRSKMEMWNGVRPCQKSAADFAARGIAVRVEYAGTAVRSLTGESQLGAGAIELSAPFDELRNVFGAFLDEECNKQIGRASCRERVSECV